MKATEYAQGLIEVVKSMPISLPSSTIAIAMAQPSEIEARVKAVLESVRNRRPVRRMAVMTVAFGVCMALVPFATVRLVAQPTADLNTSAISQTTARAPRGIIVFRYLREVASQRDGHRPIEMALQANDGTASYRFFDQQTGKSFRDLAQLKREFSHLISQGAALRPGAAKFHVPSEFTRNPHSDSVYFTSAQRREALGLVQELKQWQGFVNQSPIVLTDADIESATANMSGMTGTTPFVMLTFTARGTKLFKEFTTAHVGDILGIFVDGNLVSAPNINEPITSGEGEFDGGFHSLSEAQTLANRLNTPGPDGAVPHDRISGFRQAVATNPNDADAQYTLGNALGVLSWERLGSSNKRRIVSPELLDEAIVHIEKAVELRPDNPSWQFTLAFDLRSRGRGAEIIPIYQQILDRLGPPEPITTPDHRTPAELARASYRSSVEHMLAEELMKTHQYTQALVQLQDVLQFNPQAYWLLLEYGDALNKVGRIAEARNAWQKLVSYPGARTDIVRLAQARLAQYR